MTIAAWWHLRSNWRTNAKIRGKVADSRSVSEGERHGDQLQRGGVSKI
jgi:hypothetical protein